MIHSLKELESLIESVSSPLHENNWPFNLDQLRRVIREAYLNTDDPYIGTDSVRQVLEKEKRLYYMSVPDYNPADLSGTLEDITRRIIMQVYQEENHNQSKTAARLGISRTTLWRMMK